MKIFLGVLMLLTVSGNDDVTIEGLLEDSVFLPCLCINETKEFSFGWQKDEQSKDPVSLFKIYSGFSDLYKSRAKVFLHENGSNCSLLLTNITANDQGKYRCWFQNGKYSRTFIHLKVFANYNVCQKNSTSSQDGSLNVFQCNAEGRYREAEIQWYLDGQVLTNSSSTHITHTYTLDVRPGLYSFSSKLVTELNWTSEPTCQVKAKNISARSSCVPEPAPQQSNQEPHGLRKYLKVIPIVLVLGISLVLWCRWKQ
uniref:butyrophilin subfamily 3 member A2 isoform X2 n=1 Tax=Monopterus albus TaxID=43700 RepID=UPI0009B485CB|nr:butyrophilin subfamily 3 member A2-like isoform X2 [Monopterus albus]